MNSWGTILLGYGVVFGGVGLYAYLLIRRALLLGSKLGLGEAHREPVVHLEDIGEDRDART